MIEKATVMHYHRHRITEFKHGTVESLGWRGEHSQQARYQALIKVANLNGQSILDVGCGYGDLKAFLDLHFSDFDYLGIDQMQEFIAEARNRYEGIARTTFFQSDFSTAELPLVDIVFASGALGYRCRNKSFYIDMICKLYNSAQVALAFNMLDKRHFPQHDLLVAHDREEILAFCQVLSSRVECIEGYLEDDFTVLVHRDIVNSDLSV
ncbi:class I SAM-dependent methyltransferase [Nitrosomonas supralitoralis]|uniref:class I SAM-dependent methyltransferase n=1 Tax=Nitrosomonas supralitoralis TaxID=2116706 RepID=UPI0015586C40|nr:class I SAM-dependent methyltransferase [Nitrosomonas supralitoralis]